MSTELPVDRDGLVRVVANQADLETESLEGVSDEDLLAIADAVGVEVLDREALAEVFDEIAGDAPTADDGGDDEYPAGVL